MFDIHQIAEAIKEFQSDDRAGSKPVELDDADQAELNRVEAGKIVERLERAS